MKLGITVAYARVMYSDIPTIDHHIKLVDWAKDNGFEGFEAAAFTLDHFKRDFLDKNKVEKLLNHCRSTGVHCNAFEAGFLRHMIIDESKYPEPELLRHMRDVVDVANQLETDLIYGHTAPHPSWKIEWKRLYDEYSPPTSIWVPEDFSWKTAWTAYVHRIRKLVDVVESTGLLFALEIRPYEVISNSDSMLSLIGAVRSNNFGLVFDSAHLFVQKEVLPLSLEKLMGHIFLIHVADNDGCADYHWAAGKGKIDWENFLREVKKIRYNRFLNIDVAGKYDDIAKEIIHGRDYILNMAKKIGY